MEISRQRINDVADILKLYAQIFKKIEDEFHDVDWSIMAEDKVCRFRIQQLMALPKHQQKWIEDDELFCKVDENTFIDAKIRKSLESGLAREMIAKGSRASPEVGISRSGSPPPVIMNSTMLQTPAQ